jgi:excisionase family DNA binding protein
MSDLRDSLGPDLIAAVERLVDERVTAALAERETGSQQSWLSIEEASGYLGVSVSTIGRMLREGRVPSTYVGRRRLVRREDLDSVRNRVRKS